MASWITALLFGLSSGTYIYTKMSRQGGYGNTKNALIGASIAGFAIFIVILTLMTQIFGL